MDSRFRSATVLGVVYHFRQNSQNLGASRRQRLDCCTCSLIERAKTAIPTGSKFVFGIEDLRILQNIRRTWSFIDAIPQNFLSEDLDETMIEAEADPDSASNNHGMKWEVGSSASCSHGPKRRLLPCELEQVPESTFPSDGDEDDDSMSSGGTSAADLDDFTKTSSARQDDDVDRTWLKRIRIWAEGIPGS